MGNKLTPFILIAIVFLAGGLIYLFRSQQEISLKIANLSGQEDVVNEGSQDPESSDTCGEDCQKKIEEGVAAAVALISITPQTSTTITQASSKKNTSYISLNGPVSSTSTQWVSIPGVEVYIDFNNDYGSGATASWEANLKVAHGNGQASARLFDVTHGTAVDGSEVSTTNNPDYSIVSSSNISLWSGRNLYRLQLKSLNSFEVTFLSGHIKITY